MRVLCSLLLLIFCSQASAKVESQASLRLIVSGGLDGIHDGYQAFYRSALFRLGGIVNDLVIEDAALQYYRDKEGVLYYSADEITPADIVKARTQSQVLKVSALIGGALVGVAFDGNKAVSAPSGQWLRPLGTLHENISLEYRKLDKKTIIAIRLASKSKHNWPKNSSVLHPVPAVKAVKGSQAIIFFARAKASTARAFALIDSLLAKNDCPTHYMDLGNALGSDAGESEEEALAMSKLLMARKPLLLGAARYDLAAFWHHDSFLSHGPYLLAASGTNLPTSRTTTVNGTNVQFSVVGELPLDSIGLLPPNTTSLDFNQTMQNAQETAEKSHSQVIFGIAQTTNAAQQAISRPLFDAIFSLGSGDQGALPAEDIMDLSYNRQNGLRTLAPLVRVSPSDITVATVWFGHNGIEKIAISRHPILGDAPLAKDAEEAAAKYVKENFLANGLEPASSFGAEYWSQEDLNKISGNIMSDSQEGQLAILESITQPTPIKARIPLPLAQSLLERKGRAVALRFTGNYLKRAFKLIKEGHISKPVVVIGGSLDGTVGQLQIEDTEWYRVIVSENVLMDIYPLIEADLHFASRSNMAGNIGLALKLKGKALDTLTELKKRDEVEMQELWERSALIPTAPTTASLVAQALEQGISNQTVATYFAYSAGRPVSKLTLDIGDFDFGISGTTLSSQMHEWQDMANPKSPGYTGFKLNDGTVKRKNFVNSLARIKTTLGYDAPFVDTKLSGSLKFYSVDPAEFPEEDRIKINLSARLPMEKILNAKPNAWVVSPLLRAVYETQLWPLGFYTTVPENQWPLQEGWLPRTRDLRFFAGGSLDTMKRIETASAGFITVMNLNETTPGRAVDIGGEIFFAGSWPVGPINMRLESTWRMVWPTQTNTQADRLGMVGENTLIISFMRWGNFSVSGLADVNVAAMMMARDKIGVNALFSLALSYGNRFSWLFS